MGVYLFSIYKMSVLYDVGLMFRTNWDGSELHLEIEEESISFCDIIQNFKIFQYFILTSEK